MPTGRNKFTILQVISFLLFAMFVVLNIMRKMFNIFNIGVKWVKWKIYWTINRNKCRQYNYNSFNMYTGDIFNLPLNESEAISQIN